MKNQRLAEKLKELRIMHSYKQDDVASALGIVRQTYSHYETGRRTPGPEILYMLAMFYDTTVDDILYHTIDVDENEFYEVNPPSQSSQDLDDFLNYYDKPENAKKYGKLSKEEKEMLFFFNSISSKDQSELIEFAKVKYHKNNPSPDKDTNQGKFSY